MTPKYKIGQKVAITTVSSQHLSQKGSDIQPYAGQIGEITDCYWINLSAGAQVVYLYTVRIEASGKEVVLHEDELKACTA